MGKIRKRYQAEYFRFYNTDENGVKTPRWKVLSKEVDYESAEKRALEELDLYMYCRGVRVVDRITGEVKREVYA